MQDVMKKRIVGAVVLVIIGVLVPLLLARCLHDGGDQASQSMRVYEITPEGEARPASSQPSEGEGEGNEGDARSGEPEIDASSGPAGERESTDRPPRPDAVSPQSAPETEQAAESGGTPPVQGNQPSSASSSSTSADNDTPPSSGTSQPAGASESDNTSASQNAGALRRSGNAESGWVVQIASFGDEANARRLANELSGDFDAYYRAGDVNGKTYYRVRIGPFGSESQARSAAAQLRERGRSTFVQHIK